MRRSPRGFTLIELMVVVAIIGILSSVAIPSFRNYQLRTKQAERSLITDALHKAMTDLYMRNGRFPTDGGGYTYVYMWPNPSGIPTSYKRPLNLSSTFGDWSKLSLQIQGNVYYSYTAVGYINLVGPGTRYQYVMAEGDLDGNGIRPRAYTYHYYMREMQLPGYPYVNDWALDDPWYRGAF